MEKFLSVDARFSEMKLLGKHARTSKASHITMKKLIYVTKVTVLLLFA